MELRANLYSSSTPYLLMVNRSRHKVYIFQGYRGNWKLIREWYCGDGAASTPTVEEHSKYRTEDIILIRVRPDVTGGHSSMETICSIRYCIIKMVH